MLKLLRFYNKRKAQELQRKTVDSMAKQIDSMQNLVHKTTPRLVGIAFIVINCLLFKEGLSIIEDDFWTVGYETHTQNILKLQCVRNFFSAGYLAALTHSDYFNSLIKIDLKFKQTKNIQKLSVPVLLAAALTNFSALSLPVHHSYFLAALPLILFDLHLMKWQLRYSHQANIPFFWLNLNHYSRGWGVMLMGLGWWGERGLWKALKEKTHNFQQRN